MSGHKGNGVEPSVAANDNDNAKANANANAAAAAAAGGGSSKSDGAAADASISMLDIYKAAVKKDAIAFHYIPPHLKTYDLCNELFKLNPKVLGYFRAEVVPVGHKTGAGAEGLAGLSSKSNANMDRNSSSTTTGGVGGSSKSILPKPATTVTGGKPLPSILKKTDYNEISRKEARKVQKKRGPWLHFGPNLGAKTSGAKTSGANKKSNSVIAFFQTLEKTELDETDINRLKKIGWTNPKLAQNLSFVSVEIRDSDVFQGCIKQHISENGYLISHLKVDDSDYFKYAKKAVEQNVKALEFVIQSQVDRDDGFSQASIMLKNDEYFDFCMRALKEDEKLLVDVRGECLTEVQFQECYDRSIERIESLEYVPLRFKTKKGCLGFIEKNGNDIQWVPIEKAYYSECCLVAVSQAGSAIKHVVSTVDNYSECCMVAVSQAGSAIKHVEPAVDNYYKCCMAAVRQVGSAIKYVSPSVSNYYNCCMVAVKNFKVGGFPPLQDLDPLGLGLDQYVKICNAAIKHDGQSLRYVNESFARQYPDKYQQICSDAIKVNPTLVRRINFKLLAHQQAQSISRAIKWNQVCPKYPLALEFVPDAHEGLTADFCQSLLKKEGKVLQFVPLRFKTSKLCSVAIEKFPMALEFVLQDRAKSPLDGLASSSSKSGDGSVDSSLLSQGEYLKLCEKALELNPKALQHVDPSKLETAAQYVKLCRMAVQEDGTVIKHVQSAYMSMDNYTQCCKDAILQNHNVIRTSASEIESGCSDAGTIIITGFGEQKNGSKSRHSDSDQQQGAKDFESLGRFAEDCKQAMMVKHDDLGLVVNNMSKHYFPALYVKACDYKKALFDGATKAKLDGLQHEFFEEFNQVLNLGGVNSPLAGSESLGTVSAKTDGQSVEGGSATSNRPGEICAAPSDQALNQDQLFKFYTLLVKKDGRAIKFAPKPSLDATSLSGRSSKGSTKESAAAFQLNLFSAEEYKRLCADAVRQNGLALELVPKPSVEAPTSVEGSSKVSSQDSAAAFQLNLFSAEEYKRLCADAVRQNCLALELVPEPSLEATSHSGSSKGSSEESAAVNQYKLFTPGEYNFLKLMKTAAKVKGEAIDYTAIQQWTRSSRIDFIIKARLFHESPTRKSWQDFIVAARHYESTSASWFRRKHHPVHEDAKEISKLFPRSTFVFRESPGTLPFHLTR